MKKSYSIILLIFIISILITLIIEKFPIKVPPIKISLESIKNLSIIFSILGFIIGYWQNSINKYHQNILKCQWIIEQNSTIINLCTKVFDSNKYLILIKELKPIPPFIEQLSNTTDIPIANSIKIYNKNIFLLKTASYSKFKNESKNISSLFGFSFFH